MEDTYNKKGIKWPAVALTAIFFFIAGIYIGSGNQPVVSKVEGVEHVENPAGVNADFSEFWKVWNLIQEKYVPPSIEQTTIATEQERVWGAIKGLVKTLDDPGTTFFPPKELEYFEEEISGNFEGIGMEVGVRDDIITVIAPLKNTPAEKAGVKSGDKIYKIDDKETLDMGVDEAVKLIRGERGTAVSLVLLREGKNEPIEISITRDVINIPTVDYEWKGDVFVISLYNFSANSPDLFRDALRAFINQRDKSKEPKLILDLRGNPGGFLEASVDMASWFLPAGKVIVKEDFGGKEEDDVYRSKGYDIFGDNLKMAILIDGGSASASEILAGALREYEIATLVGSQSFGKGSVQELIKVSPNSSVKITVARWITPLGKSISLEGLAPDVEVEYDVEDVENGEDPVMEKALELLK